MANIKKTEYGTWRARVSYQVNGKQKFKSKQGFETKKEAQNWANNAEIELNSDTKADYSQLKLSDYFENWVNTYKNDMSFATQYQYKNTLETIEKYIPNAMLSTFTRTNFQEFINIFGADHSKETVSKRKNHISQSLRDAFADGLIDKDPTIRIKLVGLPGKTEEEKYLQVPELIKLNNYVKSKLSPDSFVNQNDNKTYLAIYIAIHTGMRFGEIIALEDTDVDFENKTISVNKAIGQDKHVKSTKTDSSNRVITVDDDLLSILKPIKGRIANISNYAVSKTMKKSEDFLGIKKVTFHALRHSHGSLLLSKGIDVKYVSKRLGHKNISTTLSIYTHLLDNQKNLEERKADNIFNSDFK